MFRIREFARFTRVSVKMLRHYDELGLLKPARVDAATGYRYYAANQVPRLNRIIALKDLGFTLEQIGLALSEDLSVDELRGMLKLRRAEIEQTLSTEQTRLALVEAQLRRLAQQTVPQLDVVLREISPQWVATIRQTVSDDGVITQLFEELEAFLAHHRARAAYSPLTIYYDVNDGDEQQDVEVAVPVTHALPGTERVRVYELERLPLAACVVYEGSYEHGLEALQTLSTWVEANNYEVCGPQREVYLRFGANEPDKLRLPQAFLAENSQQYVTEIQLPVRKI